MLKLRGLKSGRMRLSMTAHESWMYKDPEQVAMQMQARRIRLTSDAEFCRYLVEPIFQGDAERCNRRNRDFERCNYCNLKRGSNG